MFSVPLGVHLGVELLGQMLTLFNPLRNYHTILQSGCIILYSHQECRRFPVSLCSHQCVLVPVFFILAILVGATSYLIVVWICVSLTVNDVLVGCLHVFPGESSIHILCPFLIGLSFYN